MRKWVRKICRGLIFVGIKESDTGLAPPNLWDVPADKQRMAEEQALQVCVQLFAINV